MTVLNGFIGQVRERDITEEMQGAYLDYAMSVIVSRALPDVRDGLKPVHRRILYAMYHDLGLDHSKPHKKCARIVGEVLGKYHPHGDTAVYDAMVRMAQDFSLRYPLVDGQGNFGSIDGDNAAAMRYTEARLAEISDLMLTDLEKDTVDWHDNFDNSLREPDILPAALPNLLINGSSGIAVGMSTNIPPHNLGEVVDALTFMIDRYDQLDGVTVEHLMQFIQGPDFPTGGILYRYREEGKDDENLDVITQGYSVGRARLIMQAKAHFEEMSRSRSRIVVTELPYQANKVTILERIASLVRDGKLDGITDLRDESDRMGMRIVIELTRNADPKDVLADLFKYTPLQQTFGMQMLALVDGEPRTLSLKRMLHLFIQHRQEIIRRRSEYDLARARERAHILEGLLKALDILDEVIDTIRRSQNAETARNNLVRNFGFTEIQAQAILDMQLRRLAALERRRLKEEFQELQKRIAYLEELLGDPAKVLILIKEDLLAIKEKYADARRTQIVDRTKGTLTSTDLLPEQDVWVSISASGELRRQDVDRATKSALRQIGQGSDLDLLTANTRDFLYLFAGSGQCRRLAVHEIPQDGNGKHLAELTEYGRRDDVTAALALPRLTMDNASGFLFLVTEQGMVKRVSLPDFLGASAGDPIVMNVDPSDRLRWIFHTTGEQEVILVSAQGQSIRFGEDDVRSMGLAAGGVGGMKLRKGDKVVHAAAVDGEGDLLTVTEQGFAKRTALTEYSRQGRNGSGIVTHKPNKRTGPVTAAAVVGSDLAADLIFVLAKGAAKTVAHAEVPQMGRGVQGKQIVGVGSSNRVVAVRTVKEKFADRLVDSDLDGDDGTPEVEVALPVRRTAGANGSSGLATKQKQDKSPAGKGADSTAKSNADEVKDSGGQGEKNATPAEKPGRESAAPKKSRSVQAEVPDEKPRGRQTTKRSSDTGGAKSGITGETDGAAATSSKRTSRGAESQRARKTSAQGSAAQSSAAQKSTGKKGAAQQSDAGSKASGADESKPSSQRAPSSSAKAAPIAKSPAPKKRKARSSGKVSTVTTVRKKRKPKGKS